MIYADILTSIYNNIDEIDLDEQVTIIVKNAVNEAYARLCAEDVRLTKAYVPIINGIATMPTNLISIVKLTPELTRLDYVRGNSIVTDNTGTYELLYSYVREALSLDTDEPDLHDVLVNGLVSFAHYKYFLHRKKADMAQLMLNEYNSCVYTFRDLVKSRDRDITGVETIFDVSYDGGE